MAVRIALDPRTASLAALEESCASALNAIFPLLRLIKAQVAAGGNGYFAYRWPVYMSAKGRLVLVVSQLLQEVHVGLIRPLRLAEARHLEQEWRVLEAAVVQDAPEAVDADQAVPDVLVAVTA